MAETPKDKIIERFRVILGEKHVLTDAQEMQGYLREWRDKYEGYAAAVLRPGDTEQVSEIVKIANEERVALVPQGGNTGLVGGQIAFDADQQFVVNLSRMNKVRDVDAAGYTMTVDAGVVLETAQKEAEAVDRLFPLRIGSQGSCQIGGNLAANAGGTNVVAYGNARELVLGLEVVLPNGEIINGLNKLRKDNTGYDLKNLFIGSEGTLGFITGAVLKLFPLPKGRQSAFVAFQSVGQVADCFNTAKAHADGALTGFEIIPRIGMEFLTKHVPGARDPLADACPWYVLMEVVSGHSQETAEALMLDILEDGMERQQVADAAVASSDAQRHAFWHMREELSHCQKPEGGSIKHDVSVPIHALPDFLEKAEEAAKSLIPNCRPVPFGHWGDGNIHFNISQPIDMDKEHFLDQWNEMNDAIHDVALSFNGSISAEHGIGVMKREKLASTKDPASYALMKQLKTMLDPNGIMNPGKVL